MMKEKILLLLSELEKLKQGSIDLNRETNMKIQDAVDIGVQHFGSPKEIEWLNERKKLSIKLSMMIKDLELHEVSLLDCCGD